jgi:hypothetical protein
MMAVRVIIRFTIATAIGTLTAAEAIELALLIERHPLLKKVLSC